MGLISFFKEAGEKIFGGGKANAEDLKKNLRIFTCAILKLAAKGDD